MDHFCRRMCTYTVTLRSLQVKEPFAEIELPAVSAAAMNPLVLSPRMEMARTSHAQRSSIWSIQSQRPLPPQKGRFAYSSGRGKTSSTLISWISLHLEVS